MTGAQFYREWYNAVDAAYSSYYDAQFNDLAKKALFESINDLLKVPERQAIFDALFSITRLDVGVIPSSNFIDLRVGPGLTDYYRLFATRLIVEDATTYTVTAATNTSPIKLSLNKRSRYRTGDYIKIAGVLGNTNANGNRYLKQLNNFDYQLYTDAALSNPVAGSGTYTSGGTISTLYDTYVQVSNSSRKYATLSSPTASTPEVIFGDGGIKIYPLDKPCNQSYLDYIKFPTVFPDKDDVATDLQLSYSQDFLYQIINKLAQLTETYSRDSEQAAIQMVETKTTL